MSDVARCLRFGRLGLDLDTLPAGLVRAVVPDALGEWLPTALADLLIAMSSTWGPSKLRRSMILESWGLDATDAKALEDEEATNQIERLFDKLEGKQ